MNIENELKALHEAVIKHSPTDAILFELEINSDGLSWSLMHRRAEGLIEAGIAIRNLRGEWIKRASLS